jgi:hypothetical protein
MSKCNPCNPTRDVPAGDMFAAVANPKCVEQVMGPCSYNAEQVIYDQSFKDLIDGFGIEVNYYIHTFDVKTADTLYGDQPAAVYYGPVPVKMYIEIDNEAVTLQSFGYNSIDDFTGQIHIKTFEDTMSDRDLFIQTLSGDILPLSEFVETITTESGEIINVGNGSVVDMVEETLSISVESLGSQAGTGYNILDKFIESGRKLEPNSGDLIDVIPLGCDRPGGRCSKIFEVTERMDQDLAGGLNPLLGHYVWRVRAKRYESSFEPGAPQECENNQVYDNLFNGVTDTNIPTDSISDDKSYPGDIDDESKDIHDMDVNDTDIYGSYY